MMGREVQSQMSLLWDMEADKRALEAANRYDKKLAASKQRESERDRIAQYIKRFIKPGDFLKFRGTRGEGYRTFVRYDEKEQKVVCFVADMYYRRDIDSTVVAVGKWASTNHIDHLIQHYPHTNQSTDLVLRSGSIGFTPPVPSGREYMLEVSGWEIHKW